MTEQISPEIQTLVSTTARPSTSRPPTTTARPTTRPPTTTARPTTTITTRPPVTTLPADSYVSYAVMCLDIPAKTSASLTTDRYNKTSIQLPVETIGLRLGIDVVNASTNAYHTYSVKSLMSKVSEINVARRTNQGDFTTGIVPMAIWKISDMNSASNIFEINVSCAGIHAGQRVTLYAVIPKTKVPSNFPQAVNGIITQDSLCGPGTKF